MWLAPAISTKYCLGIPALYPSPGQATCGKFGVPYAMTMLPLRTALFAACLLLPVGAWAEDAVPGLPVVGDAIYKGVVGKALDVVPMDPERRIALQRTNAVVSSTLTGRTLSVWVLGLANPLFLIGGVAWGLFSASNIKPKEVRTAPDTTVVETEAWDRGLGNGLVFFEHHRSSLQPHPQW